MDIQHNLTRLRKTRRGESPFACFDQRHIMYGAKGTGRFSLFITHHGMDSSALQAISTVVHVCDTCAPRNQKSCLAHGNSTKPRHPCNNSEDRHFEHKSFDIGAAMLEQSGFK